MSFATPRPILPKTVLAPVQPKALPTAAVIDSVDNPLSPNIISCIVGDALPAQSGFVWNPSFTVKFAMAPNPPTAPPQGTVYYNNSTTHTGGTIVYVDQVTRNVISLTNNFSTIAGVDYSQLFSQIKHTGAYNSTGGFQQPGFIDKNQLAPNPSPSTPPAFSVTPHDDGFIPDTNGDGIFTYIGGAGPGTGGAGTGYSGGGSYDAETNFTLTLTNPAVNAPWLKEIKLYAVASGTTFTGQGINNDYPPTASGVYDIIFSGLAAGTAYDCYIAFVDQQGYSSAASGGYKLVGTTKANGLQIAANNQAALVPTTAPVFSFGTGQGLGTTSVTSGGATFDQPLTWTGDANQTKANKTVAEIQLMAALSGSGVFFKAGGVPPPVAGSQGAITAIWPTLGAGNSYDLAIRLEGFDGQVGTMSNIMISTNGNPVQIGNANLGKMPPSLQTAGPNINYQYVGNEQNAGSGSVVLQVQAGIADWGANQAPTWFQGANIYWRQHAAPGTTPPGNGTLAGQNGPQGSAGAAGSGNGDLFTTITTSIPKALVVDFGLSYLDISGQESVIKWPAGNWNNVQLTSQQSVGPGAPVGIGNVNFISDSNMDFTGKNGSSAYWTYAGFDPNRFKVNSPGSASQAPPGIIAKNYLSANANGGAPVGPVCAYSTLITVATGITYTLSCFGNLNEAHGGTAGIGLTTPAAKTANQGTAFLYVSQQLNNSGNPGSLVQVQWTSTINGQVAVVLYGNNISGSAAWSQPQFEVGSTASSYKAGPNTNSENTIDHAAHSSAVTNTILNNTGGTPGGVDFQSALHINKTLDSLQDSTTYTRGSAAPSIGPNLIDNPRFDLLADAKNPNQGYEFIFHNYQNYGNTGGVGVYAEATGTGSSYGKYDCLMRTLPGAVIATGQFIYGTLGSKPIPVFQGETMIGSVALSSNYNIAPAGITINNYFVVRCYNNAGAYAGDFSSGSAANNGAINQATTVQFTIPAGVATAQILVLAGIVNNTGAPYTIPSNYLLNDCRIFQMSLERTVNATSNLTGALSYGNQSSAVAQVINSSGQVNVGYGIGSLPYAANGPAINQVINASGQVNVGYGIGALPYGANSAAVQAVALSNGTVQLGASTANGYLQHGNNSLSTQTVVNVYGQCNVAQAINALPYNSNAAGILDAVGSSGAVLASTHGNGNTPSTGGGQTFNASIALPALGTWTVICRWFLYGTNWTTTITSPAGVSGFVSSSCAVAGTSGSLAVQAFCFSAGGATRTFGLKGAYGGAGTGIQQVGTWVIEAIRES